MSDVVGETEKEAVKVGVVHEESHVTTTGCVVVVVSVIKVFKPLPKLLRFR